MAWTTWLRIRMIDVFTKNNQFAKIIVHCRRIARISGTIRWLPQDSFIFSWTCHTAGSDLHARVFGSISKIYSAKATVWKRKIQWSKVLRHLNFQHASFAHSLLLLLFDCQAFNRSCVRDLQPWNICRKLHMEPFCYLFSATGCGY